MVKIQDERGHKVVSLGHYKRLRHPGYSGQLLYYLRIPLLLGTLVVLPLVVIMAVVFVYRTAREDQTLRAELEGYEDYSQQVRRRLFPGIW